VFINSVDTTGHKKTKEDIAEELKSYVKIVGPNDMTQTCLDNTSIMLEVQK
jgi:hypothetical protein